MIVVCAWCAIDDERAFLREIPPYRDTSVSHGMCDRHHAEMYENMQRARSVQVIDPPRRT